MTSHPTPTVKVTTVHMPQMFSIKDDILRFESAASGVPYIPMVYGLGEVCERCWLTVEIPGAHDHSLMSDWLSHEAAIRPVGLCGCPHGSQR